MRFGEQQISHLKNLCITLEHNVSTILLYSQLLTQLYNGSLQIQKQSC
jgi:hypothetical protein